MIRRPGRESNPDQNKEVDNAFHGLSNTKTLRSLEIAAQKRAEIKKGRIFEEANEGVQRASRQMEDRFRFDMVLPPNNLGELNNVHRNLEATLPRLYEQKDKIDKHIDLGLKPLLIPWEEIKSRHFGNWPGTAGLTTSARRVRMVTPMSEMLDSTYINPEDGYTAMNPYEYLDLKIGQDGPWGIMLVQTKDIDPDDEKLKSFYDKIEAYTNCGAENWQVEGVNIASMGLYEMLAFEMQEGNRLPKGSTYHCSYKDKFNYAPATARDRTFHMGGQPEVRILHPRSISDGEIKFQHSADFKPSNTWVTLS